ncbi:MAG: ComF family protein [Phycisphaerales bacterium]|nr:ComF family protein [Phycisphaerales bacterium]
MEKKLVARDIASTSHPSIGARLRRLVDSLLLWRLPTPLDAIAFASWMPDAIGSWCARCGTSTRVALVGADGACSECRGRRFAYHSVARLGSYNDPLELWVRLVKSNGWKAMAQEFGVLLAARAPPVDVIVPVAMHPLRREMRGIDHAGEIASSLSQELGVPVCRALSQCLSRRQMGSSRTARLLNAHRFRLNRRANALVGLRVALVDDVRTTGSTLQSAAALLREAGASRVDALVVAVRDANQEGADEALPMEATRAAEFQPRSRG